MRFRDFLHRLAERPAAPIVHTLICGASRSGKSEAELRRLVRVARAGGAAVVLLDPPGTLARKLLLHLHAARLDFRVVYDRLADTDRVPGYQWLAPSAHPDPFQREAEDDERVREFAAVLLRRRSIHDPALTPLIEEGILLALRLFVAQRSARPLAWVADAYDLGSPRRALLLAGCADPKVVRRLQAQARLSPTQRRIETGPAERILRAVLTSPAFRVRSERPSFDLAAFLKGRGILILDGASRGNLSRDAAGVMMGAVILQVIRHCRAGAAGRVLLVLDEAVNAGLVGAYESQALAEAGKWGLEFHVIVQDPFGFQSEEILGNVLQNTWRHEWFRQGSAKAARLAAEDVAVPRLDPLLVHHVERRPRTAFAGRERRETPSHAEWTGPGGRGRSKSWGTVFLDRRREVVEEQPRYTPLADQVTLVQRELMTLGPGWRYVRDAKSGRVPEYSPMLPRPRTAGGQDFEGVLAGLKAREVYGEPTSTRSVPERTGSGLGAAERLRRRVEEGGGGRQR